jgi:uracil-DNA glycosylase family 4
MDSIAQLNEQIVQCRRCPRLVEWRERVAFEKKRAHADETYWGKPVPIFGDPNANRLIVGLAPAAHGANRTGQMFTGDRSGEWLYRALYRAGVANHPGSESRFDGMRLTEVAIAAVCHCAPPDNKPLPEEIRNCSPYLTELLNSRNWMSVLCLGGTAWGHVHRLANVRVPKFQHGAVHMVGETMIVASYHPSQQNTFTGKLTEPMLDHAIALWLGRVVDEQLSL